MTGNAGVTLTKDRTFWSNPNRRGVLEKKLQDDKTLRRNLNRLQKILTDKTGAKSDWTVLSATSLFMFRQCVIQNLQVTYNVLSRYKLLTNYVKFLTFQ